MKRLRPGDTVAIVAPAGPADADQLAAVPALYARHDLVARIYPGCLQRQGYLAGDDTTRLADLHAALADDGVAAIHCLRGGYGAMRLLDGIDAALVQRAARLLIGYSDITALQALWARAGLPSLHAPMPASDLLLPGREADGDALFALLTSGWPAGHVLADAPLTNTAAVHAPGVAEGLLVGGNLTLVAALLGTPWAWRMAGAVLFLEDVGEAPYRVDRCLTQLRLAGVFEQVAGVVLGSFSDSGSGSGNPAPLLRSLLLPLCRARGIPLAGGWPAGHGTPNRPLPLNVPVRLEVSLDGRARLQLGKSFLLAKSGDGWV